MLHFSHIFLILKLAKWLIITKHILHLIQKQKVTVIMIDTGIYFFIKKTPQSSIRILDQILNDTELAWAHLYAHKIQTKYVLKLKC